MAKVELKQPIVDEIKASLEGAQGVVVVDYRGLTVEQDTQLRKQLREAGVVYKVYKNTLVKRAIAGTEFEPMTEALEGPNAIAICKDDATAPARVLANFAKTCLLYTSHRIPATIYLKRSGLTMYLHLRISIFLQIVTQL